MSRCIILIDMDCFYCQVEQQRLGLPATTPLAVQQWQLLIAVNYAARAQGVKRLESISEALKKCPELRLVHVATLAEGDSEPRYHDRVDKNTHKVSLDQYRRESTKIMELFQRHTSVVERASIDEAFIDVTDDVDERIAAMTLQPLPEEPDLYEMTWDDVGHVFGLDHMGPNKGTLDDIRMMITAQIARDLRAILFNELGYTCTAGIARNKAVAKLAASLHKPNQQTVVPNGNVLEMMRTMPLNKIRGLAGKLGDTVEKTLALETAGELWRFSLDELRGKFGDATATWLYNISRGNDDEKVAVKNGIKNMMAAKSFKLVTTISEAERWLHILASELIIRLSDEHERSGRWPKSYQLQYNGPSSSPRSRSAAASPPQRSSHDNLQVLYRTALALYTSAGQPLPLIRFALCATGFDNDVTVGLAQDITLFFKSTTSSSSSSVASSAAPQDDIFPNRELFHEKEQAMPVIIEDGLSPEMKKRTLYRFFKRKTNQNHNEQQEKKSKTVSLCPSCHKELEEENRAEHEDFHVAQRLQSEWAREQPSSAPPKPSTKHQTGNLQSFFGSKSQK